MILETTEVSGMKAQGCQQRRRVLLGLTALASGIASRSLWAQESRISVVTEEWPPYNYIESGVVKGFSVEIVQAILKRLNEDIQIQLFPSMRASYMLNTLPGTLFITMFRTPERETQYKWIGPLDNGAIYFYKRKDNPLQLSSLEDAKKVKVICSRHAGLVLNTLKAAGFNNLESSATDGFSVYKKLILKRCDLGISDAPLGVKYLLKQMGYPTDAVVQTAVRVIDSPLYIACSKDIPDQVIALWQKALDDMKASGAYAKIHAKYND